MLRHHQNGYNIGIGLLPSCARGHRLGHPFDGNTSFVHHASIGTDGDVVLIAETEEGRYWASLNRIMAGSDPVSDMPFREYCDRIMTMYRRQLEERKSAEGGCHA